MKKPPNLKRSAKTAPKRSRQPNKLDRAAPENSPEGETTVGAKPYPVKSSSDLEASPIDAGETAGGVRDGYLLDYISGQTVRATPEEVDAVQIFSRILVEDFQYPRTHIRTRPQWRVKARPSDVRKEYPVDIAVFATVAQHDGDEQIIVECKKKNRKDGRTQLEDYLRFCKARIGVWFNGEERLFLKKTERGGKVHFEEIPNIPRFGERLEDIGMYRRRDLRPTHNLKSIFRAIRNYLAANAVGATRDEVFAQQIINLIFCKIYDERFTKPEDQVKFHRALEEKAIDVADRVRELFSHVKSRYSDVIDKADSIVLDDQSLAYIVGELQLFCLTESARDVLGDAFETFIGPSLKGSQGQFFTPRNVVSLILHLVRPTSTDKIIDPACGSGGFLVENLRSIWRTVDTQAVTLGWPEQETFAEKQKVAIQNIRGIDKDEFLAKVAKAYMAILGDGRGGVFCDNALQRPEDWKAITQEGVKLGTFDVVTTNPPFGKKLKVDDESILKQFKLAHRWKFDEDANSWTTLNELQDGQAPQILFIERCLDLLRKNGRLGMIAPESMFCNPSHRYILQLIESLGRVRAVVSLPEELFQPHTHAKTCAVLIEKGPTKATDDYPIFMAIARWCGHDSRGLPIPHDDIPKIVAKFDEFLKLGRLTYDHLGFVVQKSQIRDSIYLPKYYNPEIDLHLVSLRKTHDLWKVGDLVREKVISISTGHEVGKLAYGTGKIPFIRTSEIANWEIKADPKHGLSLDIYDKLKKKQDVRENDILMVRDGTYLVGSCALVTAMETEIVFQSHLYKLRSNDPVKLHPYLLLTLLTCPIVKEQIYAKRFTQDIIDTLGGRLLELVLPVPKDDVVKRRIVDQVRKVVDLRTEAKRHARTAVLGVAPADGLEPSEVYEFQTMKR